MDVGTSARFRWCNEQFNQEQIQQSFAVKRLKSVYFSDFQHEAKMLLRVSNPRHPHIIKLVATYSQNGQFHLVFPLANGNLSSLWKSNPSPLQNLDLYRWIAYQCHGSASGLRHIQEHVDGLQASGSGNIESFRHGDIKPENILFLKENGNTTGSLVIPDLGSSCRESIADRIICSPLYATPELMALGKTSWSSSRSMLSLRQLPSSKSDI
jgi:serine/threonine protein kinase